MEQGTERRNKVTTRKEEVGQINTQKEKKLAVTSTEAITKRSQATSNYQPIGRRDPGRQRRRWLDG
jgi:hypothetical protein